MIRYCWIYFSILVLALSALCWSQSMPSVPPPPPPATLPPAPVAPPAPDGANAESGTPKIDEALATAQQFLAGDTDGPERRGGHVQWARLQTNYRFWSRHDEAEGLLAAFIRENTSLGIDRNWAAANLYSEKAIWNFPLLYAEAIHSVTDKPGQQKLREYIKRGGFLLIDGCINPEVNPDPDVFFQAELQTLHQFLPEAKVRPIAPDDEVYHCFFPMAKTPPHHFMGGVYDPRWAKYPLHAIEFEGRRVAILSLSGLKCGYSYGRQTYPDLPSECVEMLVNIYVYALTH